MFTIVLLMDYFLQSTRRTGQGTEVFEGHKRISGKEGKWKWLK